MLVAASSSAHAHIRMSSPAPRSDDDGLKTGPCGDVPRGSGPLTSYELGTTVRVSWAETIDHPGWYRIAVGNGDDEGFDNNVLADQVADRTGGGSYAVDVALLPTPCEACTLQLIQYMTDKPTVDGEYQRYFACADIAIVEGIEGVTGDEDPDGGPTLNDATTSGGCAQAGSPSIMVLGIGVLLVALRWRQRRLRKASPAE